MNEISPPAAVIPDQALDVLFRAARSYTAFMSGTVSDATLRALYELMKWGPTTSNSQPQRIVFLRSQSAQGSAGAGALEAKPDEDHRGARGRDPGLDLKFFEHLPRMFHNPAARSWYEDPPEHAKTTSFRNATLQGGYFILAARALGLDAGPMSGFDNAKVDSSSSPTASGNQTSCAFLAKASRVAHRPAIRALALMTSVNF